MWLAQRVYIPSLTNQEKIKTNRDPSVCVFLRESIWQKKHGREEPEHTNIPAAIQVFKQKSSLQVVKNSLFFQ